MGNSCLVKTHVRNSKGNMVESRLFNDLLSYLPSRESAKEYYAVGTNDEFLNEVKKEAKFDENGEITFNSLRKLSGMNISEEEMLDKLNKEIGAGTMDYQKAISKVTEFNKSSQFNDSYLATISYDKGQYNLSVIPKTASNIAELQRTIERQELKEKLLAKLKSHGVSVTFTEEANQSRYSTINVEQAANGMYNLIQISHGEHMASDLAEEAGHFAVAALGHNPLVSRLTNLLSESVRREILGEEYNSKDLGINPRREIAGMLVGQALERQLSATTPWQKMANRIADLAKSLFAKFSGNDIRIAREQANKIARNIASGFLSDNFEGNIANALDYKETLKHAELPYNVKVFKQTVDALGSMAKELSAIAEDDFSKQITSFLAAGLKDRDNVITDPTVDSELVAFQGLCQILSDISDLLGPDKEIDRLLNSVDFNNPTDFYERMPEHGEALRKVRTFVANAANIASILQNAIDCIDHKLVLPSGQTLNNAYFKNVLQQNEHIDFRTTLRDLKVAIAQTDSKLQSRENAYFCRFCEDTYGSKYVNTVAQIIWKKHSLSVTVKPMERAEFSSLITNLEDDINIFHRFIGSMSNNPDVTGQVIDKVVKAANKMADDRTIKYQERLIDIEERMRKQYHFKRGHTEMLYEKSDDGGWTGNLITPPDKNIRDPNTQEMCAVNYGKWEKAREEFKKQCWEEFKTKYPNWESWSGFTRGYNWNEFYRNKYKQWNKENSTKVPITDNAGNTIGTEWRPNYKYKSTQFDELTKKYPGIQTYLAELTQIKKELDDLLPMGANHSWRAPQFKGTFMNKVQNKNMLMSKGKAYRKSIRDTLLETFCESSEDTDYGSLNEMTNPKDELMGTPLDFEKEKPHRLPLFGINKLEDMTQLSTDIFHSLLSYASMASSYNALDKVVDAIEVGKAALENRHIHINGKDEQERVAMKKSRAYTRFLKYLDRQVYGISATHYGITLFGHKVLLNKCIGLINRLGSFIYLAGNVLGGWVNTGTGFIEIFKEAMAAEYFSPRDWWNANVEYFKYIIPNLCQPAFFRKNDKMSLFNQYFNTRGDNREKFRSRYGRRSWLARSLNTTIYFPYSSGDHYMQSMSYIAIAKGTHLYSANGKRKSQNLWDSYKRTKDKVNEGSSQDRELEAYTLGFDGLLLTSATGVDGVSFDKLEKNDVWLKKSSDRAEYNMMKGILGKVEQAIGSPILGLSLTQEEKDYLASKSLGVGDLYKIKTQMQNDIYKMIWTKADETAFMDKSREINNRMHGIYNNQDKTAWHNNWYTNAYLSMKGYALGLMERRFSNAHHSTALGIDVEGSLVTMSKLWLSAISKEVNTTFKDAAAATLCGPFMSDKVKQRLKDAGFSDFQVANTRRNWMDYMFIILLYTLKCALTPPDKDDDEEPEDVASGLGYYFATRLLREQSAYNIPQGIKTESNSIMDLVPVGFNALFDLGSLSHEMWGAATGDEEDSDFFYQRDHPNGKYYQYEPKYENHVIRMIPYWKSIYNLNNPYEATESYEFGSKLKRR